jgi:ABC-type ATPase involved in cell division
MKTLISSVANKDKTAVVIATHNENSILQGLSFIREQNVELNSGRLYFAQLYGMYELSWNSI